MPWTTYKDKEGNSHDIDNVDAQWLRESGVNEQGLPAIDEQWVDTGLAQPANRESWWRTAPHGWVLHPDGTKKLYNMEAWGAFNRAIEEALLKGREAEAERLNNLREGEAEWLKNLREGEAEYLDKVAALESQRAAVSAQVAKVEAAYKQREARAARVATRTDTEVQRLRKERGQIINNLKGEARQLAQELRVTERAYNREFEEAQQQYELLLGAGELKGEMSPTKRKKMATEFGRNRRK